MRRRLVLLALDVFQLALELAVALHPLGRKLPAPDGVADGAGGLGGVAAVAKGALGRERLDMGESAARAAARVPDGYLTHAGLCDELRMVRRERRKRGGEVNGV